MTNDILIGSIIGISIGSLGYLLHSSINKISNEFDETFDQNIITFNNNENENPIQKYPEEIKNIIKTEEYSHDMIRHTDKINYIMNIIYLFGELKKCIDNNDKNLLSIYIDTLPELFSDIPCSLHNIDNLLRELKIGSNCRIYHNISYIATLNEDKINYKSTILNTYVKVQEYLLFIKHAKCGDMIKVNTNREVFIYINNKKEIDQNDDKLIYLLREYNNEKNFCKFITIKINEQKILSIYLS